MVDEAPTSEGGDAPVVAALPPGSRPLARRVLRAGGGLLLALILLLVVAAGWLHTGSGRQFIVDRIARVAPASGLSVEVGRISGSPLWGATLYDVKLRDADHKLFLAVPEVELNWRPYRFLYAGLDVRHLVLHRGTLYAKPRLLAGDPNAPTLPNFDIRIDQFVVDRLTVARGLLGEQRVVSLRAKVDIRKGLVYLKTDGDLGGGDRLNALVYAEPDGNRFDLDVDYRAPQGGLIAKLIGTAHSTRARLKGTGTWTKWDGQFVMDEGATHVGAFKLYNRSGTYKIVGQARPGGFVTGLSARALGPVVSLLGVGTLKDSVLDGLVQVRGRGVSSDAHGKIDLAHNTAENVELTATLLDKALFGPGLTLRDTTLKATLNGKFRALTVPHVLTVGQLDAGGTVFDRIVQRGTITFDGTRYLVPVQATVARVTSGNAAIDPRLVGGRISGTLVYDGKHVDSRNLVVAFPGLTARLALAGDLKKGAYALAGPVRATGVTLRNLGVVDTDAKIQFRIGNSYPWQLDADFSGRMTRVTNATLANLTGGNVRFRGRATLGAGRPAVFHRAIVASNKLSLIADGKVERGVTTLTGSGRQADYGPFTVQATMAADGPHAALVFANPYPAAGLRDVKVALAPTPNGFRIDTSGQSLLGPFDGRLVLVSPPRGPTRIDIERLNVWRTQVTGSVTLATGGATGTLRLSGGGLDGTVALAARGGGQGFDVDLTASDAQFAGPTPLGVRQGRVQASGFIGGGKWTVNGTASAAGITYGSLFIGRLQGQAQVTNGAGTFAAQIAGRRGSQFDLNIAGDATPSQIRVAAKGSYAGRAITMPRRAVLLKTSDGGWALQPTQLTFGSGIAIAQGRIGGNQPAQGRVQLAQMPLSLIDALGGDFGLGGTASGIVNLGIGPGGVPVGDAQVMVSRLARSGLNLASRPIDLALVARLSANALQARAVVKEDGQTRGRFQARIDGLPLSGALRDRLYSGNLTAQLRYSGPADALWRLVAIELFDVTGTIDVAADVHGSLRQPLVNGSLAGTGLRVQSPLTGSDLRNVAARGTFSGSRLQLTSFAGTTPNGGRVTGSGMVDLSNLDRTHGPGIDLRMAMRNAEVMNLSNMGATVTGPMRIVSDGNGGTIAGRLQIERARWVLGGSAAANKLPNIRTREINLPPDLRLVTALGPPWRYLIDATAPGGVMVTGMGLDSEWSADVRLRGTTENPIIGGEARVVPRQGFYSFAGSRFEITRGVIDFDEVSPPDPRLNIQAESKLSNLDVFVSVTGNSSRSQVTFTSNPGLPEEEILTRLLFGDSITNLSATDALQLGAALASLRGGGGMDPINKLRTAIGLDRLRIVAADPALDRGTAIALGKNFGRRFYVEIITDGRGYNATQLEFRITNWLTLLATVNTIGRNSVAAQYSKDY
ncbi:MAG: translocation/assembly module TamB domain-containing protein [Croceibacterium sp.]